MNGRWRAESPALVTLNSFAGVRPLLTILRTVETVRFKVIRK
jgi:hypothetical protein